MVCALMMPWFDSADDNSASARCFWADVISRSATPLRSSTGMKRQFKTLRVVKGINGFCALLRSQRIQVRLGGIRHQRRSMDALIGGC